METTGKTGLERRCALTRSVLPTERLIRFVADPSGAIVPDLRRRLPGRGVWIEARRAAVAEAVRKKVFSRSMKKPVAAPDELAETVADLIRQRALAALSIAKKAGALVVGFQSTADAIASGRTRVLVHASDAAADGRAKLGRKGRGIVGSAVTRFTTQELSLALGRPNVVHAAGLVGPATEAFLAQVRLLERYDEEDPDGFRDRGGENPAHVPAATVEARSDVT